MFLRQKFYYFIMCDMKHGRAPIIFFCACVCAADDEEEEKINKFFTPVGPPEAQFIEDVTEERIKLGKLARELSQDPELLQAS